MSALFCLVQRSGFGLVGRSTVAVDMERSTRAGRTPKANFRGMASSKMGNKNFYKGRRAGRYGRLTSKGKFILEADTIPKYDLPSTLTEEIATGSPDLLLPYVWRAPANKATA